VVQARRAKVRPVRVIIPLAVAGALLVGGSFAAWKFWPDTTTAGPQAESSITTFADRDGICNRERRRSECPRSVSGEG